MSESAIFSILKALIQFAPEVVDLIEKVIADCKKEDAHPLKHSPDVDNPSKDEQ